MGKRLMVFLVVMAGVIGLGRLMHFGSTSASPATGQPLYTIGVPREAPIPHEALRLRIIANSNSRADQNVKLQVRNRVVVYVAQLLQGVKTPTAARAIVEAHVPQLNAIARQVLKQNGFTYGARTNVGVVPFPTKVYGNQVYPAGQYEALRIILGKGLGQNWWCVLFPPLCFVDITTGDAVPNTGGFPDLPPLETVSVPTPDGGTTKVQVRLASVDYGEEFVKTVQGWFHRPA